MRFPKRWKTFWLPTLLAVAALLAGARPTIIGVLHWQVRRELDERNGEAALRLLDYAATVDSNNGETQMLLARAYRRTGDIAKVGHHLQNALDAGVEPDRVRREEVLAKAQSGNLQGISREIADMFISPGDDGREICEAWVRGCIIAYRFEQARSVIESWQAQFPDDPQPFYLLGRMEEHLGNWQAAADCYDGALALQPEHGAAAWNAARLATTRKEFPKARKLYETCAAIPATRDAGRLGLAVCLRQEGELSAARQILQELQLHDQESLRNTLVSVGEPIEKAASAVPAELGRVERAMGHHEEAAALLKEALEINPQDWQVRYALAQTLQELGREDEAEPLFEEVTRTREALSIADRMIDRLRENPDDVEARFELGRIFLDHVSERQAEMWLRSVLVIDPEHRGTHRLLERLNEKRSAETDQIAAAADRQPVSPQAEAPGKD